MFFIPSFSLVQDGGRYVAHKKVQSIHWTMVFQKSLWIPQRL